MIANKMRLFKLALPLFLGVGLSSICGIFVSDFYAAEIPGWRVQAIAQDYVDLFLLLPTLVISFLLLYKGVRAAIFVWVGALLYTIYSYLIYAFAVHFNSMFLVYCAVLGLAVYSVIMLVVSLDSGAVGRWRAGGRVGGFGAAFLILVSIAFYGLWLSDIIPAMVKGVLPASVKEVGGAVNPVHVIDLSLMLPAMFFAGVLYFKRNPWGTLFAPALITFMVLINFTIGTIVIFQVRAGLAEGYGMAWAFGGLGLFCILLFTAWVKTGIHK